MPSDTEDKHERSCCKAGNADETHNISFHGNLNYYRLAVHHLLSVSFMALKSRVTCIHGRTRLRFCGCALVLRRRRRLPECGTGVQLNAGVQSIFLDIVYRKVGPHG